MHSPIPSEEIGGWTLHRQCVAVWIIFYTINVWKNMFHITTFNYHIFRLLRFLPDWWYQEIETVSVYMYYYHEIRVHIIYVKYLWHFRIDLNDSQDWFIFCWHFQIYVHRSQCMISGKNLAEVLLRCKSVQCLRGLLYTLIPQSAAIPIIRTLKNLSRIE